MKKRFRFLIYPRFQMLLVGMNLLILVGVLIPLYWAVHRTFESLGQQALKMGIPPDHGYFRLLVIERSELLRRMTAPLALGIVVLVICTVLVSDRLAGPILRLRSFFSEIRRGAKPAPVQFRKGDFFQDLPEKINRAIDELSAS